MKFEMYDLEGGRYHSIPVKTAQYRFKSPRDYYQLMITSWGRQGWAYTHSLGVL